MKTLKTVACPVYLWFIFPFLHLILYFTDFQADICVLDKTHKQCCFVTNGGLPVSTRDCYSKEECHLSCLQMTAAIAHLFKDWHPGGTSAIKWILPELE